MFLGLKTIFCSSRSPTSDPDVRRRRPTTDADADPATDHKSADFFLRSKIRNKKSLFSVTAKAAKLGSDEKKTSVWIGSVVAETYAGNVGAVTFGP